MQILRPDNLRHLEVKRKYLALLLIISIILVLIYNLLVHKKAKNIPEKKGKYQMGDVMVDTEKGEIKFAAVVQKNKNWVQFLIYISGYKWLKKDSAIISSAELTHLQNALALLNWKMWDDIWYRKRRQKLNIFIRYKDEEVPASNLILSRDRLHPEDIFFFGSPYFDEVVFNTAKGVDCTRCPIYPLEKKALKKLFKRKSGLNGYKLNSKIFPPVGEKVVVIIRLER